jgi:hypothetical protein
MATFFNPANRARSGLSIFAAGLMAIDKFTFSLAASYATGAATDESLIEIGIVPAGQVLVPQLSLLDIPVLDSNGAPTGDYEIGTAAVPAALKASAAAETAVVLFGEDWLRPVIGSETEDTPILIRVVNVIATLGSGTITFQPVFENCRRGVHG